MASGDTKTEAMLNALGNGGSADEFRGCCNTKTQQYILDAIDRVQNVEDEVEELKNNPDVVDIVDTYADLQAYDTQHLSDNDIIRVLADETHSGNSTYYKFNKQAGTWTFIGEIAGGGGGDIKTLSTDDYNYPTNNPDRVALWLLPNGLYRIPTSGVSVYYASNSIWTSGHGDFVIIEKYQAGVKPISMYFFGSTDGVEYCEVSTSGNLNRALAYTILSDRVSQSTGNGQYSVMSQNAVTSMVYNDPSTAERVQIGGSSSAYRSVAIGKSSNASSARGIAIGDGSQAGGSGTIALGAGSKALTQGEMNIGVPNLAGIGYNNSDYRLLSGLYDPQSAHDAATKGYVDAHAGGVKTLTSADYNYPVNNPTSVALWLLDAGVYDVGEAGLTVRIDTNTTTSEYVGSHFEVIYAGGSNPECSIIRYHPYLKINKVRISDGAPRGEYSVIDTLTSQPIGASSSPLSARQGKVLYDYIGDLTSLTTADKTSLVNAINELAGRLSALEGN